ncbi:MAG: alpha/beta hydrolase [Rhizomicrobium sp.]|jgi:acetyl esterase
MSLNPVMKAILDQMAAQPAPKMWQMSPSDGRLAFTALMQFVGPQNVPIGGVADVRASGPHGAIRLRNYTPVAAVKESLPTLVFYHGGGFVIGDLDTHDGLCRIIANESGSRVVAVDYRLAPEHKFSAAVDDSYAALTWIAAHAAELGVDANRLAVGGDSAGGGLAAVVAQMARDRAGPTLAYQLLLFPVTQIGGETRSMRERAEGFFLEKATLDWFFNHYLGNTADRDDVRASPLLAKNFAGLPPAYLMVAGYDPLHDEGVAYAGKLKSAGVSVTVADYPDLVHDFIYMQAVLPQAGEALRAAAAALRTALVG